MKKIYQFNDPQLPTLVFLIASHLIITFCRILIPVFIPDDQ